MKRNDEGETRSPSQFRKAISKVAVAQICQSVGFTGSQHSTLEALSDIATRYLEALAKSASSNANSSGRTESNIFDVILAIEDMSSVQGFRGASDINKSLLDSAIINDLMSFVRRVDEIPFAKPIPRSNAGKRSRISRCLSEPGQDCNQIKEFSHVPPWLPAFPDPSTYKNGGEGIRREEGISGNEEEHDREANRVVYVHGRGCEKGNGWDEEEEEEEEEEKKRVLPAERPKVRFKMELGFGLGVEVGLRTGICRGSK